MGGRLCMLKKAHAVHRDLVAEAVPLDPVAEFVKNTIAANKVVIFSKTTCPYSEMAKEQFRKLNYANTVTVELNKRDDGDEIQSVLAELTGGRTVPRVFIDGKFIGGGTDVKKLYDNGSLKGML